MNLKYNHPTLTNISAHFISPFKTAPMNASWRLA